MDEFEIIYCAWIVALVAFGLLALEVFDDNRRKKEKSKWHDPHW